MKVKYEQCTFMVAGEPHVFYIMKTKKHWWNRWKIEMNGEIPLMFERIGNYYLAKM